MVDVTSTQSGPLRGLALKRSHLQFHFYLLKKEPFYEERKRLRDDGEGRWKA